MNFESTLALQLEEQIDHFTEIVTDGNIITGILFRNSEGLIDITQILPGYGGVLPTLLPTSSVNFIRIQ
jgi:hypothetical protein